MVEINGYFGLNTLAINHHRLYTLDIAIAIVYYRYLGPRSEQSKPRSCPFVVCGLGVLL